MTRLFVAVANGVGPPPLGDLPRAVPDAERLAEVLARQHGFTTHIVVSPTRADLWARIDAELAEDSLLGGTLVLSWTGHGTRSRDVGPLQLLCRDGKMGEVVQLAQWAGDTGASQVLILLDVCYAGAGITETVTRAVDSMQQRDDTRDDWFGIVAASRADERAVSGALADEVVRLLEHGPAREDLRAVWLAAGTGIDVDLLLKALDGEWPHRQAPQIAQLGSARPVLNNPVLPADWTEGVVEHLLTAARSTSTGANFFVGRTDLLTRLVARLATERPGLVLVTGPPGSGKTAVLGRIVSLSDAAERAVITTVAPPPASTDPGQGCVDAHVHLRSLRLEQVVEQLCARLRIPRSSEYALLARARERATEGKPLVVVADGLDEADPLDVQRIASTLLVPLAREAIVLIASRPFVADEHIETMLGSETAMRVFDLAERLGETARDVREYVERRLAGMSEQMRPGDVADEIVAIAEADEVAGDGPFLLARLLTSQLRGQPVDTGVEGWQAQLARSVAAALERDLDRVVIEVGGRPQPTAARELLTALAHAQGSGFPADELWADLASALSPSGHEYGHDEIVAVLSAFGRHIIAGRRSGQAVFRIAHQRLAEHLLAQRRHGRLTGEEAGVVAQTVYRRYSTILDGGADPRSHAYLWLYAWRHLADAGNPGLELLERLVERDRDAFLPDLALGLDRAGDQALDDGSVDLAITLHQREVDVYRELDGDGLDLAFALFDVSYVRALVGDVEGSRADADEAIRIAWQHADDPEGIVVLSAALGSRGQAARFAGDFDGMLRFATEAIAMITPHVEDAMEMSTSLALARLLAAEALLYLGRLDELIDMAEGALADVDGLDEPIELLQFIALTILTRAELTRAGTRARAGDGGPPSMAAAVRLYEMVKSIEPKRVLEEQVVAEATCLVVAAAAVAAGSGLPDADRCADLIDQATARSAAHAQGSLVGALVYGLAVNQRSSMRGGVADPDLEPAIAALSRYAETNVAAAAVLAPLVGRHARDPSLEPSERARLAIEAADLLANAPPTQPIQLQRCSFLMYAAQNAVLVGDHQLALVALELAEDTVDRCVPPLPDREFRLALTSSERSGLLLIGGRVYEGLVAAQAAIDLFDQAKQPAVTLSLAQARMNLIAASVALGRPVDEGDMQEVIALLETVEGPVGQSILGRAVSLLVDSRLARADAGDDIVALAGRVVELLEDEPVWIPNNRLELLRARIRLSRALHAAHQDGEADDVMHAAAADLAALAGTGIGPLDLALLLAGHAASIPDELLNELGLDDEGVAEIRLFQENTGTSMAHQAVAFAAASDAVPADDIPRRNAIREIARKRRALDPAAFDSAWTEHTGTTIPEWLGVDPALGSLVVAWFNTDTWSESCEFLEGHPELLDPATEIYLAEFAGADHEDMVDVHREILAAVRAGDDTVYGRLLADGVARRWLIDDDPIGWLMGDHDEADLAEILPALTEIVDPLAHPVHAAVLTLLNGGEWALAARIASESVPWRDLLENAWCSADDRRLLALATLCASSVRSNEEARSDATVARAIAEARLGGGTPTELVPGSEAARERWRSAVTDALSYDDGQAGAALVGLLATLRRS